MISTVYTLYWILNPEMIKHLVGYMWVGCKFYVFLYEGLVHLWGLYVCRCVGGLGTWWIQG